MTENFRRKFSISIGQLRNSHKEYEKRSELSFDRILAQRL